MEARFGARRANRYHLAHNPAEAIGPTADDRRCEYVLSVRDIRSHGVVVRRSNSSNTRATISHGRFLTVITIRYADGETVMLGDHVSYKSMLFWRGWKPGRVSYVPGVSPLHPEMEHGGLTWLGVSGDDGTFRGIVIHPQSAVVEDSVRFVKRSDGTEYLTPDKIPADEW